MDECIMPCTFPVVVFKGGLCVNINLLLFDDCFTNATLVSFGLQDIGPSYVMTTNIYVLFKFVHC